MMDGQSMREVVGFPGYLVSPSGDVYSTRCGYLRKLVARPHKGYLHVQIKDDAGKQRKVPVHQVVLYAYGEHRTSLLHGGRHLDGDASNNSPANLVWGTQAQNIQDAIDHGTHVSVKRGEASPNAKLSDDDLILMRSLALSGHNMAALGRRFGVSRSYVCGIKLGYAKHNRINNVPIGGFSLAP